MARKKKQQCDLETKLYWNGLVTLGYPKCEELLLLAQVEWINFTINITGNYMCVSQIYNIHIPLVSTFKMVQEWGKECEKFLWKRCYLNASCKTGSSYPFTFNPNDHKVQSSCCYSLATKPLENVTASPETTYLVSHIRICDIQCGCYFESRVRSLV